MARMPYTWRQPPYPGDDSDKRWIDPSMIILCEDGDINAAIGPLLDTLYEPIGTGLIAAVFVHETLREQFIEKVRGEMTVMHRQVKKHDFYKKALRRLDCLGAETVAMMQPDDIGFQYTMVEGSPIVVCDFSQSYFSINHPSTVVTLHTFRHSQELGELTAKEHLPFVSAAIWCPKMSAAYEIALLLNVPAVYINCAGISLMPIVEKHRNNQSFALLLADHHYEVLVIRGRAKAIVFPAPLPLLKRPEPPSPESPSGQKPLRKNSKS
ncbi:uncharacterized protein LOC117779451 [Drosophila innubila]|uniref:uncharacterized protein LOC117779451 n=1 Tax=Drosophila innubila TaxID=198719 RepID=UPI00148CE579|nr:uncharacterized protein LOC117779451 [Drosophila innubila]